MMSFHFDAIDTPDRASQIRQVLSRFHYIYWLMIRHCQPAASFYLRHFFD
jgi:hypothetical protein